MVPMERERERKNNPLFYETRSKKKNKDAARME